jgi:SIR2-like domain
MLPTRMKKGRTETLPRELVDDMVKGESVIFLGSDMLEPPRFRYIEEIQKIVEEEKTSNNESVALLLMKESRGLVNDISHLIYLLRLSQTTESKKYSSLLADLLFRIVNGVSSLATVEEKNTDQYQRAIAELRISFLALTDILNESANEIDERTKHELMKILPRMLLTLTKLEVSSSSHQLAEYSNLRKYLESTWSTSAFNGIYQLSQNLGNVHSVITTIFDHRILNALTVLGKNVSTVTGIESTSSRFPVHEGPDNLLLYQVLGRTDKPETLWLSSIPSKKDSLFQLRSQLRDSENARNFIADLLKGKSLILLGYQSEDIYDAFFREIFNDISYDFADHLTRNIYLVNRLRYYNYTGIWGSREENDVTLVELSPFDFITKLQEVISSAK